MFQVSPEGVVTRDEKVFRFAKDQNIPLLMLTSGETLLFSLKFVVRSSSSDMNLLMLYSCALCQSMLRYQEAT